MASNPKELKLDPLDMACSFVFMPGLNLIGGSTVLDNGTDDRNNRNGARMAHTGSRSSFLFSLGPRVSQ